MSGNDEHRKPLDTWMALLDANPGFERKLRQFMMLHDAAEVLDELQPPHGGTAAEFLREVANHVMRDAGIPEELLRAMISARPAPS